MPLHLRGLNPGLPTAAALALALLAGCRGDDAPSPTKVDPSDPVVKRPRRPETEPSPFKHADREGPSEREGEQLPEAEIDAQLSLAKTEMDNGRRAPAITALRACANKIPASARCDGELALLLGTSERRKGETRYYLGQAARVDDPKASAALYASLCEESRKLGALEDAVTACEFSLAREDTAEGHLALSRVLQGMPDNLARAAEEMGKVYAMDPGKLEYLFEHATVLAQVQTPEAANAAADLFKRYLDMSPDETEERRASTQTRITELRAEAKSLAAAPAEPKAKKKKAG